jgi:hypothetical protein
MGGENMKIIDSKVTRDRKGKKDIYVFSVNNELFEAHYCYGDKPTLTFFHNGAQFGFIYDLNSKVQYSIESESEPIIITGWIEKRGLPLSSNKKDGIGIEADGNSVKDALITGLVGTSGISLLSFKNNGIGIEIDGIPIQNTLTDPNVHIGDGRVGLIVLLIVFALKGIIQTFLDEPINGIAYIIPALITLVLILMFKKTTIISIIGGIIMATLELIDYVAGVILQYSNQKPMLILTWIVFRMIIIYALINAFRWMLKLKGSKKKKGAYCI